MSERLSPIQVYPLTPATVTATGTAGTLMLPMAAGDHGHALAIVTTRGDIIVRDATNPVRLALGTNGQVLQSNGTDLVYGSVPAPAFISQAKWYTD